MKDSVDGQELCARLIGLAQSGDLPERVREPATRLAERLDAPVRVMLLGPRGVGKSQLLGALIGQPAGALAATGLARGADAALSHVQFHDLAASGADWAGMTRRALAQADVVLWCTQAFGPAEAALWAEVSDDLKDHSFLVLTQVGALADSGELASRLAYLQVVAVEEFHSLFPTETAHLAAVLADGDPVSAALDTNSGVRALRQALLRQVDSGRRAWEDAALALLGRFEPDGARLPAAAPRPVQSQAAPEAPAMAPPTSPTPSTPPAPSAAPEAAQDTLSYLSGRIADLTGQVRGTRAGDVRLVLDHCLETCDALAARLAARRDPGAGHTALDEDVLNAADKMLLMAMEEGAGPAADAVTILLQMRREFESRYAA